MKAKIMYVRTDQPLGGLYREWYRAMIYMAPENIDFGAPLVKGDKISGVIKDFYLEYSTRASNTDKQFQLERVINELLGLIEKNFRLIQKEE